MKEETRYIFSKGDMSRKDFSICFRKDNGLVYLPIKNIRELYCFNDITFSSKLLESLSRSGIVMHLFGYYGNYIGTFYPKDHLISGRVVIKQALAYENHEKRMHIAKAIINGIADNIYFTLYHYYRHGKANLKEYLDWLRSDVKIMLTKADNIKQVLAVEGEIWARFYSSFQFFLPDDFIINSRIKRPPDNPMNAMISFGNTLLYTKTVSQLYETHLNQSISFLHEPMERRFSLSLDISEVFKPIIVFKTIFECVNNRKITVEKHFDKKMNYALLNELGRKVFIEEFEKRLNSVYVHSKLRRKVTYKSSIKLDGYKLIKYLMEDIEFCPFSIERGQ